MSQPNYRLVIGNHNTSSWSLRPWLAMKVYGVPFEEIQINLRDKDHKAKIFAHSPSGKVPALYANDLMIWDSLAIMEYIAEQNPSAPFWPDQPDARAVARSAASEMHSSFHALRQQCPMDFNATKPMSTFDPVLTLNIKRVISLWKECRAQYGDGGPYLFSKFSIADAMYAPVASRFKTYIADLTQFGDDGTAAAYIETLFALPAMHEWGRAAGETNAEAEHRADA